MAMLAPKLPFQQSLGGSSGMMAHSPSSAVPPSTRRPVVHTALANQSHANTTRDDDDTDDEFGSVRSWNEERVCEFVRSVKCGDYEKLFRNNHIDGQNLLELSKADLREMGVEKVGDLVRLLAAIKKLRTKAQAKRDRDSVSMQASEVSPYTTSLAGSMISPRRLASSRSSQPVNKRFSRQLDVTGDSAKGPQRPHSPLEARNPRRLPQAYSNAVTAGGLSRQPTSGSSVATAAGGSESAHSASNHNRNNSSVDGSLMAALPQDQNVIRVISRGGVTKVVKVANCKNCEEVMRVTLRKFALREDHERNYCFWVLSGLEPDPGRCRRLGDTELWRIIKDLKRPERNRLILRKIPDGDPGEAELKRAAQIAVEEAQQTHTRAIESENNQRSHLKVQRMLGEKWTGDLQRPLSPVTYNERDRSPTGTEAKSRSRERRAKGLLRQFGGMRPPSELITADLRTYFPDHPKEEIDRTARLSVRRSMRLSKYNSRLSVASNFSMASGFSDAPPMPSIAGTWLAGSQVARLKKEARMTQFRDSVVSTELDGIQEETSSEPNRKSYVSFGDSSGESTHAVNVIDPEGNTVRHSYLDEGSVTGSGPNSLAKNLGQVITEDDEDADEELQSFLAGESWDDSKWMKGALIGQGSFGCVYLALHAITGELLAVKQVETPSPGSENKNDAKKKSMIDALKREIALLRDLRHPNIVQYLGCSSTAEHLNIFLEYVPGGSVQTMLNSYGALPEPLVRSFVRQILTGLSYLHSKDVIHRDIKGANILVDNKGTIKISDFGVSKKLEASNILQGANNNRHRPSLQGSVFWMAPEVVKQSGYSRNADIWSLGCLVVEMMTGTHPFPDCSQLQAIFKIGGGKVTPTIPDNASVEATRFLKRTFEIDHNRRPNADELMESDFLQQIA